jgi:hypothetical protein
MQEEDRPVGRGDIQQAEEKVRRVEDAFPQSGQERRAAGQVGVPLRKDPALEHFRDQVVVGMGKEEEVPGEGHAPEKSGKRRKKEDRG